MSALDEYFGPKQEVEMPVATPTHFGRYPPRIRAVADAFIEEMGWHCDPTTKKIVAAGSRRFIDVHGEDVELLVATIKRLRRKAPHIYQNIASPGSLITPARRHSPDSDSDEHRQKYLKGMDDE